MIETSLNRELYFKYMLYKNTGEVKELKTVENSGSLSYGSLTRLKISAQINLEDEEGKINFLTDEIQIICIIDNIEYPIARLVITSPSRNPANNKRAVECYSRLIYLDWKKLEDRYVIRQGTNIINEVKRLIGNEEVVDITESTLTQNADRIFEVGTPFLDVINELLSSVNYNTLTTDIHGKYTSKPYILPAERIPQVYYKDDITSLVLPEPTEELDLFNVPNVWLRYTNNADIDPPLIAKYENNSPASLTSTVYRRRIVDVKEVTDVADLTTLYAITKKDAVEASTKYSHINFQSGINPAHGYLTCIQLTIYDINDKYIETNWDMELRSGGKMKHTARKVVNI